MPPLKTPPPSRTVGNVGPVKVDIDPSPDNNHYLNAAEWNEAIEYLISLYASVEALMLSGANGTLYDAYLNHALGPNIDPCRIFLDANNAGVIVTDHATPIAKILFGVSADDGSDEYGFWAHGLQLSNSADAIHTDGAIAIQMRSGQNPLVSAAYVLDTQLSYGVAQPIFQIRNGTAPCVTWQGGGGLIAHNFSDGTTQWALSPAYDGTGLVRLLSDQTGGGSLGPQADGVGKLGSSSEQWLGIFARYHATAKKTLTFAASLAIDLADGEWQQVTLTADLMITGIASAQIGAILSLHFIQDGTGGWKLTLPGSVVTNRPFGLSRRASDEDVLVLRYSGTSWYEVGRYQSYEAARSFAAQTLTSGTVTLKPHFDEHTQELQGVLSGPVSLEIDPGGVNGDRIEILFDETNGVETTAVNTLTIKETGGSDLIVFNQAKTLRGRLLLYHNGTIWKYSGSENTTLDYT